jgi:hypothetical protein
MEASRSCGMLIWAGRLEKPSAVDGIGWVWNIGKAKRLPWMEFSVPLLTYYLLRPTYLLLATSYLLTNPSSS